MTERPGFFKFFLSETSKAQLKIPIAFIECIGGALPEKVRLRDRYNNLWTVKVVQVRKNWYFRDGWVKFVEDNRMASYDFIVFEYFLVGLFDFKILGPSATETRGAGAFLSEGMRELVQVSEEVKSVKKEDNDNCEDADYIFKMQKVQSEANGEDDDETKDADCLLGQDNESDDEVMQVIKASTFGNSYAKRTSLVPKYYGLDIFLSGRAPAPINPYFIVKIMPKRRGDLFIPLDLIKDHSLQLPNPEIILVDPRGRKFRGKYRKWKDGRILYTRGWRKLCNSNFVEQDDIGICEFLQGDVGLYLNISFVRADRNEGKP